MQPIDQAPRRLLPAGAAVSNPTPSVPASPAWGTSCACKLVKSDGKRPWGQALIGAVIVGGASTAVGAKLLPHPPAGFTHSRADLVADVLALVAASLVWLGLYLW